MSLLLKHSSMKSQAHRRPEISLPAIIGESEPPIMDDFDLYCQIANSPSLGKTFSPVHTPTSPFEKVDSWIESLPSPPSAGKTTTQFLFPEECLINKSRSKSFKENRRDSKDTKDTVSPLPDDLPRPRASSMNSRRQHHSSVKERRTTPSELEPAEPREQLMRVRSFRRTKHGLVNQGDSVRARSNCSLNSSQTGSDQEMVSILVPQVTVASEDPDNEEVEGAGSSAQVHHHQPHSGPFLHQSATCQSFNIQIMGAPSVGKTTLVRQFMSSKNQVLDSNEDEEMPAADPAQRFVTVLLDREEYHMTFLDTERADEPQFISVLDVDAYMVVFAVDSRRSFSFAKQILNELVGEAKRSAALLFVANKSDLVRNREVSRDEAKSLAGVYNAKFIEISTAFNHRVDELLISILSEIKAQQKRVEKERSKLISKEHGGRGFRNSMRLKSPRQVLGSFIKKHFTSKSCEDLGGS